MGRLFGDDAPSDQRAPVEIPNGESAPLVTMEFIYRPDRKSLGIEVISIRENVRPVLVFVVGTKPDASEWTVLNAAARSPFDPCEMRARLFNVEASVTSKELHVWPEIVEMPVSVGKSTAQGIAAKIVGKRGAAVDT